MDETQDRENAKRALTEKWENTPSPNPRFRGLTPREVARALVKRPPAIDREEKPR